MWGIGMTEDADEDEDDIVVAVFLDNNGPTCGAKYISPSVTA